jgi:hypothetical protein
MPEKNQLNELLIIQTNYNQLISLLSKQGLFSVDIIAGNLNIQPLTKNLSPFTVKNSVLKIDQEELQKLYLEQDYEELTKYFLSILDYFHKNIFQSVNNELKAFINIFIENFMFYWTKADFEISKEESLVFLAKSPVITNLTAISDFRATDPWISILLSQPGSFYKLLPLVNCRNTIKIDRKKLFDTDTNFASIWYGTYFMTSLSFQTKVIYENMNEHLNFWDPRMVLTSILTSNGYMLSSYINHEKDRVFKRKFNSLVKGLFKNQKIKNQVTTGNSSKRKIAVIAGNWFPLHVNYRNFYNLIASLQEDFDLTLIHLHVKENELLKGNDPNSHIFKEIKHLYIRKNKHIDLEPVAINNFSLAFFIDVGIEPVSRFLSNIRIAPVQVMTYGHSVSSFGSEIDYFIGGVDSEEIAKVENYYDERVILTPGLGLCLPLPDYKLKNKKKQVNDFIINCPWSAQKINYPMIKVLIKILGKSTKKILYRFYPALFSDNYFLPCKADLEELLGRENVEVFPNLSFEKYMETLEEGDLTIDSHTYGGMNSVIDSLLIRKPVVSREGWQHYNKAGSAILRKMGLPELIAHTEEEYISKISELINNDQLRAVITEKISVIDLENGFKSLTDIASFKKAISYLIENHNILKNQTEKNVILVN